MKNPSFWGRRLVRHGIGWVLVLSFFAFLLAQSKTGQVRMFGLRYSAALLSTLAVAIYVHYALLQLLERRRFLWYVLGTVATVLAGAAVLSLVRHVENINLVHFDTRNAAGQLERLIYFDMGSPLKTWV